LPGGFLAEVRRARFGPGFWPAPRRLIHRWSAVRRHRPGRRAPSCRRGQAALRLHRRIAAHWCPNRGTARSAVWHYALVGDGADCLPPRQYADSADDGHPTAHNVLR